VLHHRSRAARLLRFQYVPLLATAALLVSGVLTLGAAGGALKTALPALAVIASVMVITSCAVRLGLMDGVAFAVVRLARGSGRRLYALVFGLSALIATTLNNDAAVLLLVPVAVVIARRAYPMAPAQSKTLTLVVFMAAGVAPLVISNPMNLIVAEYIELGFNDYARHMIPVAVAGWAAVFAAMALLFRRHIAQRPLDVARPSESGLWRPSARRAVMLLVVVLGAYPLAAAMSVPLWAVAVPGALAFVALYAKRREGSPSTVVRDAIAWDILVFLAGVSVVAAGLEEAGAVDWLRRLYGSTGAPGIAAISAVGSALLNNHPMSLLNVLALEPIDPARPVRILSALIGGNLGPRLLPWGSLAGLLWFHATRELDVVVTVRQFVAVGTMLTLLSLPVCSLTLSAVS
jgi:arsenical pump membrane protein